MHLTPTLRKVSEFSFALTAVATLVLAGCGGGGGSTSNSGGTTPAATTITTTVTPFKGMFTSGTVVLKDANGNIVSLTSGGSINASGVASVTYPANVAYPLTIEVSGTFLDETSGLGATGTISAGTPLRGLIPAATDAQAASGVPVTVVTELARTMLPASGFSAASAVAAITGAASSVIGVTSYNQAMLPPVFNSQGRTSDVVTLKLTALAHVINQQGIGADLPARMQNIAAQLAAGSAVNAVIPQSAFNNALGALNGGASSVLPIGAMPPPIPPFTPPSVSLGNAISGGGSGGGGGGPIAPTPSITGFNPTTGAAGTSVTVTGTNLVSGFPPAPTFKFGTTNAGGSYTNVSNTGITFTVPAGLAAGTHTLTVSGVTMGTFTVTASGGGSAAFPNEAITLPSVDLNAISNPTMAATDVSSMVGTYTGTKSTYQTNVDTSQVVDYSTAVESNSCQLTFAANRTLTLTDGTHTFTQTANDSWTHSMTGEANTGFYQAGAQSLGVGATGITMQIGRGKLIAVTAQVYTAAPAVMSEKLTCWMPINRMAGTAGSNVTTGTYYDNASDLPATVPATYTSTLLAATGTVVPPGSTCQLVVAANGSMTFTTTGLATNANMTVQIAGDYDDRVVYTNPTSWSYTGRDISDPISGAYNSIQIQPSGASFIMAVSSGTVRPLSTSSYTCM